MSTKSKPQPALASSTIKFPTVLPKGATWVTLIRGFVNAGSTKAEIMAAYVEARLPDFATRKAYQGLAPAKLASVVRKHGNTHFALAIAELNPNMIAEKADRLAKSVADNEARLARAKERATAAGIAV